MHAYGKMSDLEREGSSSSSLHPSGSTMPPPSKRMKQMKIQIYWNINTFQFRSDMCQ